MTVISDIYLEVNSIPLETYAWRTVEPAYDELLNTPALIGADLDMLRTRGVRAYPRRVTATVVSIPLLVIGSSDEDGDPTDDPMVGMMTHRDTLRSGLGIANDAADADRGTVTATFYRRSLASWQGPVTVLGLNDWTTLGGGDALVRLDLSIPGGELPEAGS